MATLTIRNLPEDVHAKLRVRAAQHGRSTEAEVRAVLAEVVGEGPKPQPTVRERVARLQAAFAPFRSANGSVVDELIAERRIEAWKENLESIQHINSGIDWASRIRGFHDDGAR
jgi:plasmid stability protein